MRTYTQNLRLRAVKYEKNFCVTIAIFQNYAIITYMIKHGDTIGILALAGVCEEHLVKQAVLNIESLGFKVRLSKNIYDKFYNNSTNY